MGSAGRCRVLIVVLAVASVQARADPGEDGAADLPDGTANGLTVTCTADDTAVASPLVAAGASGLGVTVLD